MVKDLHGGQVTDKEYIAYLEKELSELKELSRDNIQAANAIWLRLRDLTSEWKDGGYAPT